MKKFFFSPLGRQKQIGIAPKKTSCTGRRRDVLEMTWDLSRDFQILDFSEGKVNKEIITLKEFSLLILSLRLRMISIRQRNIRVNIESSMSNDIPLLVLMKFGPLVSSIWTEGTRTTETQDNIY